MAQPVNLLAIKHSKLSSVSATLGDMVEGKS